MLTTERILTHARAFGLTSASPLQRAFCRVGDGLPIDDLATDPAVIDALGGPAAIASLPTTPPIEVHELAAIRTAKSMRAAAKILQLSQIVEVSQLSRGDIVRIGVLAIKLENTKAIMSHLVANGMARDLLRPLFVGEPSLNGTTLLHPSGRHVDVVPMPLDRAGASLQSTWLAGAVIDEEPRMIGAEDGVKNWDHARDSILGRLLPRGQLYGVGSPWAPFGPIYDLVLEHHGRPTRDLVVLRGKGPDLNPVWWTPERCEDLRRRNFTAYRTDVLCEFADVDTGLLSAGDLDAVTRREPAELPPEEGRVYYAAIDPATRRNAFTLVIGTADSVDDDHSRVRVALARQWTPAGGRLSPDVVFEEIADVCWPYRVRRVATDQFSVDAMRDVAARHGLALDEHVVTAESKRTMFEELRAAIVAERFEIGPDPVVRSDLLSIRKRVTQAGVSIVLPTTSDGRHADYAPAVALLHEVARAVGGRSRGMGVGRGTYRVGSDRGWW